MTYVHSSREGCVAMAARLPASRVPSPRPAATSGTFAPRKSGVRYAKGLNSEKGEVLPRGVGTLR